MTHSSGRDPLSPAPGPAALPGPARGPVTNGTAGAPSSVPGRECDFPASAGVVRVSMSDAELVARVLDGDARAFAALAERHHDGCARLAWRLLGHRQDAEDAIQEALLRAYQGLGRYREQDQFRSWLYRILVNQCRTLARRRTRQQRLIVQDPDGRMPARTESEERRTDLRDAFQVALDELEPKLKEAVLLKYGEGLEYAEISHITGAGISALKMRVKRASEILRPRLGEVFGDS